MELSQSALRADRGNHSMPAVGPADDETLLPRPLQPGHHFPACPAAGGRTETRGTLLPARLADGAALSRPGSAAWADTTAESRNTP